MIAAASSGDESILKDLIDKQAGLDVKDDVCEWLCRTSVSIISFNMMQQRGWTALMKAASAGHLSAVSLLMSAGANPEAENNVRDALI